jgi:spore maturation protein CgeB
MTSSLRLVVFGLSLSSTWGNGHATTYRSLLKAFAERGHEILFLERDMPWYAASRDLRGPDYCRLELYDDLAALQAFEQQAIDADAVIVGSYVPDGIDVGKWALARAGGVTAFYDIDTPVTLAQLDSGRCAYLSPELIPDYDLYLSFTGGPTLGFLERDYGSPAARPLYCAVDADAYRPLSTPARWALGYLGTYSIDRQPTLERLLLEPARRLPHLRFAVAGPQYPDDIAWPDNVDRIDHVASADHPAFYSACRFTLNVTRADMVRAGYSPSVRLFEAAACATPIISDVWEGIDDFFAPGEEILLVRSADEIVEILSRCDEKRARALGEAARARVLGRHTARHRAAELESYLSAARERARPGAELGTKATINSFVRSPT